VAERRVNLFCHLHHDGRTFLGTTRVEVSHIVEDGGRGSDDSGPSGSGSGRVALSVGITIVVVSMIVVIILTNPSSPEVERSTWAFEMVGLEEANDLGLTGEGVRVGIIDTGIDPEHPALEGVEIVAWRDLLGNKSRPYDNDGHGTGMASLIAGRAPLRGGAFDVELIVVRVVNGDGSLTDELLADAIDFCVDPDGDVETADGADIISLSLGGRFDAIQLLVGTKTENAIVEAVNHGVLLVAAAGNSEQAEDVLLPGRFQDVICVGAVDRRGDHAPFSTHGNSSIPRPDPHQKPEVVAPGVDIQTAHSDGEYAKGSGTSQATAITSSALAAALSGAPDHLRGGVLGGDAEAVRTIKEALMASARPLGWQQTPHDEDAGYGLVDAVELARELGAQI
jgi:serine protease AprX